MRFPFGRFVLLALGMLALLTGLWAGLIRLGLPLPLPRPTVVAQHGALMISGFLGTLIALERAVAYGSWWAYGAPLLTGLGAVALIVGLPLELAQGLLTLGSLLFVVTSAMVLRRQVAHFTLTLALAAGTLLVGNALWLAGRPIPLAVPWWGGFLVLTIAAERLELSRLLQLSRRQQAGFFTAVALLLGALALSLADYGGGLRLLGAALLLLAIWLLRHDVARRTVRLTGLTRFIAVCLLSGYVWLGVSGALAVLYGGTPGGPFYDAILHALFLGFVFAMIFGHAPVIFPAVLGVPVAYRLTFYLHLALLHLSLALRIGGDLAGSLTVRQCGGVLGVLAIVAFLLNTLVSTVQATRAAAREGVHTPTRNKGARAT